MIRTWEPLLFCYGVGSIRRKDERGCGIDNILVFVPEKWPCVVELGKVGLEDGHAGDHSTWNKSVVGTIVAVADQLGFGSDRGHERDI